ncbi:MAG TPA: lipid-binding SYLF domain-containing protein [Candidatus Binatia bacterium]|jgi:lipid-binding SYLF domain-containing protein
MKRRDAIKAIRGLRIAVFTAALVLATGTGSFAASKREIDRNATTAVNSLLKNNPKARELADKSVGVLIFPSIVKGGFIIAGQYGDGVLRKRGKSIAYYRSLAASYGFQAGAQAFGYVLFFMDDDSIAYLDKSGGFELGSGPSLVVLDSGFGKNLSTTTLQKGIYAVIFNQKGLMGGVGIQGSKITKINPDP